MTQADFGNAAVVREPFPHLKVRSILPAYLADRALRWLRDEAPWCLRVESFYEQHEFSLQMASMPTDVVGLASKKFTSVIAAELAARFDEPSGLQLVDASAHRLCAGQTIRIHNDWLGEEESHRLLIQINAGWNAKQGGLLMLFGSGNPTDLRQTVLPVHGSGFAFEIGPHSHHAVSTTHGGERFTLVYTYRRTAASASDARCA